MEKQTRANTHPALRARALAILPAFLMLVLACVISCISCLSTPENDEDFGLLDLDGEVPELHTYRQSGPNDIRDVLVMEDGILAATGGGIVHYAFAGDGVTIKDEYTTAKGLPSDNCFMLRQDAEDGIWVFCERGVGHLAKGADKWLAFTEENGLAPGAVTNMALCPKADRIWVSSTGGLATATVRERKWKTSPQKNPIDIFVHPAGDIVWCRRLLSSSCFCGRHILTSQFNLKTGSWLDVPDTGNCSHVAASPAYFCPKSNRLWLSGNYAPPLMYDPSTNKTKTWPAQPNWERVEKINTVVYSDWFGRMLPFADDSARMWFATNAGLWQYDPKADQWQIRRWKEDPGCGQALLVRTSDGNTIYWACEEEFAAYDIPNKKWRLLWKVKNESYGEGHQELMLSPDEKFLWWLSPVGLFVGNLETKKSVLLTDKDAAGLRRAGLVRFDGKRRLALIATSRGLVYTDYAGKVRGVLKRSSCPITYEVKRFVFAPDGSEVWCLMEDDGGFSKSAAVLYPSEKRWEEIPDPRTERTIKDVTFSKDGKTIWLSVSRDEKEPLGLLERTKENPKWVPIRAKMPEYYGEIDRFYLTPSGEELWMGSWGSGLLRLKLASGKVSKYAKIDPKWGTTADFPLTGDYIRDLVFTADGKYAVCSAGGGNENGISLIDLTSGKTTCYPTKGETKKLFVASDQKTVTCLSDNPDDPKVFDLEARRWVKKPPAKNATTQRDKGQLPDEAEYEKMFDTLVKAVQKTGGKISCLVEVPRSDHLICALSHHKTGGIYLFDKKQRSLRKLMDVGSKQVGVMAVDPKGRVWAALPGSIVCINASTEEIRHFK
ncbi:MAG: hypothetical protein KAV00_11315 [Phycisphaerae bacterium]|nr:hypothetical protein [Phycisphaerae bacterium]